MYQPAGNTGTVVWRRTTIEVAGIMIAGNCIVCLVVVGFMFLLMGTITMAASPSFNDGDFFRDSVNVPRVIGAIFLSIGSFIFVVGIILLIVIITKARREARTQQGQTATASPGWNYGTTQPNNLAGTQPYPATGPAQLYPSQTNAPYTANAGQGQYPQASEQEKTYPKVAEHGQPYPQGPGQQPYPQVTGQGQPYPQGLGQQPYPPASEPSYPLGTGQPYPPTVPGLNPYPVGGHQYPDRSTDSTNPPYNPGHPYQSPHSGYPESGHPPPDAPPPYSDK